MVHPNSVSQGGRKVEGSVPLGSAPKELLVVGVEFFHGKGRGKIRSRFLKAEPYLSRKILGALAVHNGSMFIGSCLDFHCYKSFLPFSSSFLSLQVFLPKTQTREEPSLLD